MEDKIALLKLATPFLKQGVQPIIDTYLKPKLEEWKKSNSIDRKLEDSIFDNFSEYLKNSYNEFRTVNFIAIGNEQIDLESVYQPLTIETNNGERYLIDCYNEEIASKYKKILIKDIAGMGKSTLMKKMFISAIKKNIGLPVFIELKKLEENNIVDIIFDNLSQIHKDLTKDKEFILNLINRGDFIFFLDGYDEIPFDKQQKATEDLKKFISKAQNNIFFMTSRPEKGLASFGEFKETKIVELKLDESFELIKKLDVVIDINIADQLIEKIEDTIFVENNFEDLSHFLGVPLLTTLIYVTFRYKRNLSTKKDEFYDKVFNALYEEHDLSKNYYNRKKHTDLSKTEFFKLLSYMAYLCLKVNKIEFKESNLVELINEALLAIEGVESKIKADDVLKDISRNVPIFIKVGIYYKWAHKSFMEYFSACYINSNKNKGTIIKNIYNSERFDKYLNFLDIYYDIDPQTFEIELLLPILEDYINFIDEKNDMDIDDKSLFFNNMFYIKYMGNKTLIELLEEKECKRKDQRKEFFNKFRLEAISIAIKSGFDKVYIADVSYQTSEDYSYFYSRCCENNKYEGILSILSKKSIPLFKSLENIYFEDLYTTTFFASVKNLVEIEVEELKTIRFCMDSKIMDYQEAIKYRDRIKYLIKNEEDLSLGF